MPSNSKEPQESLESFTKIKIKSEKNRGGTSYLQTLLHLFKGNVGPACFAMGEAMKHSGLILGPILTISLSVVCVYQQNILINCSNTMRRDFNLDKRPDYAETLELSLMSNAKWRKHAKIMKTICNIFLIVTQLGFCAVYFLFVGNNVKNIFDIYGLECNLNIVMTASLISIIPTSLITNLRYLGELRQT